MTAELVGPAQQYQLPVRRQGQAAVLFALVFSVAVSALLVFFPPGWFAVLFCMAVAFLVASWYRPVVGVAIVLAATLLFEQFDFALFRPVTRLVPFFDNASRFTGLAGLEASPLEMLLVVLSAAVLLRMALGHRSLRANPIALPICMFIAAVGVSVVYGLASGGAVNIMLWELRAFAYFCLLALMVPQMIAAERDVRVLLWVAIVFVGIKAAQGAWNYLVILRGDVSAVRSVTAHEDALFIGWMTILLAALFLYRSALGQRALLLVLSPLMALTFVATDRRAAFVALAFGMAVLAVLVSTDRTKRTLVFKWTVSLTLLFGLVVAAGWNSKGALGTPAATIKSIIAPDNQEDLDSSYYRRAEEVNLIHAIESSPVLGLGFGRPFQAPGQGGIVDIGFSLQDVIPHNAILWVWSKMGTVGFALFWSMVGWIIVFGGVTFRTAKAPYFKAVALLVTCAVCMQMVVSYVDLQLTYARNMVFLGVLVGILSQLPALDKRGAAGESGR